MSHNPGPYQPPIKQPLSDYPELKRLLDMYFVRFRDFVALDDDWRAQIYRTCDECMDAGGIVDFTIETRLPVLTMSFTKRVPTVEEVPRDSTE